MNIDGILEQIQEKQLRELVRKAHLGNEEAKREYLELIRKAFLGGDCYNHLMLKYVLESVDRELKQDTIVALNEEIEKLKVDRELLQDKIVALHEEIEKLKNGG